VSGPRAHTYWLRCQTCSWLAMVLGLDAAGMGQRPSWWSDYLRWSRGRSTAVAASLRALTAGGPRGSVPKSRRSYDGDRQTRKSACRSHAQRGCTPHPGTGLPSAEAAGCLRDHHAVRWPWQVAPARRYGGRSWVEPHIEGADHAVRVGRPRHDPQRAQVASCTHHCVRADPDYRANHLEHRRAGCRLRRHRLGKGFGWVEIPERAIALWLNASDVRRPCGIPVRTFGERRRTPVASRTRPTAKAGAKPANSCHWATCAV